MCRMNRQDDFEGSGLFLSSASKLKRYSQSYRINVYQTVSSHSCPGRELIQISQIYIEGAGC